MKLKECGKLKHVLCLVLVLTIVVIVFLEYRLEYKQLVLRPKEQHTWTGLSGNTGITPNKSKTLKLLNFRQDKRYDLDLELVNKSGNVATPKRNTTIDSCRRKRFLVYYCDIGGLCGGMGDRQRAIVATYLTAVVLRRQFAIMMEKPCPLQNFLNTNKYNWLECNHVFGKPTNVHRIVSTKANNSYLSELLVNKTLKERVIFLNTNRMWLDIIRNHTEAPKRLPWMMNLTKNQVVGQVLKKLFKPNGRLRDEINMFETEIKQKKRLVCAHIRMSNNPSLPQDQVRQQPNVTTVFQFLTHNYQDVNETIYVASDSNEVKEQAKSIFRDRVVVSARAIVHVDRFNKSAAEEACEGLFTALYEQTILSTCDVLVLTMGGFGATAAFIRNSPKNLFCYSFTANTVNHCNLGLQ